MIEQHIISLIHNLSLSQDVVISLIVLFTYILRIAITKPSKIEIEALTKALLPIVLIILKKVSLWNKDKEAIHPHLSAIKEEVYLLRSKLGGKAQG